MDTHIHTEWAYWIPHTNSNSCNYEPDIELDTEIRYIQLLYLFFSPWKDQREFLETTVR